MSGTSIGAMKGVVTRGHGGPGLRAMRKATPKGLCPFCLGRVHRNPRGVKGVTCGEPDCRVAYVRCWRRDQRASLRALQQQTKRVEGLVRRRA